MGTWPGKKGRGDSFGGHGGERAGWVMARVGNDRGELDRVGGGSPVGKRRGEDAGGGGDRLDPTEEDVFWEVLHFDHVVQIAAPHR